MDDARLENFLNEMGQLLVWPKKQDDKELVIFYLASKFEFARGYHEREMNEILKLSTEPYKLFTKRRESSFK